MVLGSAHYWEKVLLLVQPSLHCTLAQQGPETLSYTAVVSYLSWGTLHHTDNQPMCHEGQSCLVCNNICYYCCVVPPNPTLGHQHRAQWWWLAASREHQYRLVAWVLPSYHSYKVEYGVLVGGSQSDKQWWLSCCGWCGFLLELAGCYGYIFLQTVRVPAHQVS